MTTILIFVVAAVAVVITVELFAERTGLPAAAILTLVGVVYALLPGPNVELDPEIVLAFILPPLLYSAALHASLTAIRTNLRAVISLSVGLVLATALLVACELADAGELAVNVRVLVEGEEETPADTAERWMAADERGAAGGYGEEPQYGRQPQHEPPWEEPTRPRRTAARTARQRGRQRLLVAILTAAVVVALVVLGLIALVRYLQVTGGRVPEERVTPEELLAERFARGEIDEQDYRARLDALRARSH